ncbi:HlyC/CorC family transporter [Candidatus Roizmanbacteria bacterium]|nr:HlyC/CorC family transporter [Candidatus Roizmanbacteria bacterium]
MDFVIILILIIFNGFFAMAEIAIISSRKSKLKNMAMSGGNKEKLAYDLAEKPNMFLSSIQIGITLVTILAGAVGEDMFTAKISPLIKPIPILGTYHEQISFVIIISVITYLSIVIGELVPKRIALNNPEKIASFVAPIILIISNITSPIIRLLSVSTEFIFKLLGLKQKTSSIITEDEIRVLIREGTDMGIFSKTEKKLIERALMLDDLRVGMLMTPKHKMTIVNIEKFTDKPKYYLSNYPHSRLIFTEGKKDKIFGIVHVKDLLSYSFENDKFDIEKLKKIANKPHLVPESMKAIKVLELFRHSPIHIALVIDEFGTIQGLVTLNDILEALVGEIKSQSAQEPLVVKREDGSFLVDGTVTIYELKKRLKLQGLTNKDITNYQTTAGFVIAHLDKIPETGDKLESLGYQFEVIDMDNNRVDKILVKKIVIST